MRRVIPSILLLAVTAFVSAGCGVEPETPAAPAYGTVTFTNYTGDDIAEIRFRQSGAETNSEVWSRNLITDILPADTYVPHGYYLILRMRPGTYDFLLQNPGKDTFWTEYGVSVSAHANTDVTVQ